MDLPGLSGDRLRAFYAVAEEGGFSRAARRLGQSQSSVSQAVRALEDELGEQLFVRSGRTTLLTDVGKLVLTHARRVFAELAHLHTSLEARRELREGRLALGTSDTFATYVLPPAFARFRQLYPNVELSLDNRPSPLLAERVAARALDLAVVSLPLPSPDHRLTLEPLAPQHDVVILPPGHALAARRMLRLEDLGNHPLVLLDRTTATRALFEARFRSLGIVPRVVMEMSSVEVLKRLVELGFGLSIVSELSARSDVAQGKLVAVPLRGLGRERRVGLVTPREGPLSPAARAFRSVLVETLSS